LNDPNLKFSALITDLQGFGIVERLDTFWAERIQLSVQWDPIQGIFVEGSTDYSAKDLFDSLDASTSSEETVTKHFDPRNTALPAELVPLCNLYDRHILRQKVVIQLSLPAGDQAKMRSSGGDAAIEKVDHIHYWHLKQRSEGGEEAQISLDFSAAVDLSEEDIVLVSDDEDAEGIPYSEDDEQLTLSMDLNLGLPDYKTTWIGGAEFKDKSPVRCSFAQPCGFSHLCLRCRAGDTKKKYEQWDMTDSRVAAHLLLHKRNRRWKPLRTNDIWEYLMDLDENLMKRPRYKRLCRILEHCG
jgi:hypothetical protein